MNAATPSADVLAQQSDATWQLRHCGEYDDPEPHRERYIEATNEIARRLSERDRYRLALEEIAAAKLSRCSAGSLQDVALKALGQG